ncbi:THO complex subunit 2 [Datura stramonium]|uniref:THO complex subunit 2 n=1 Tax=Datura stramonium TaxID=4076 RepID=A0ABS8RQA4_DATST|nr:THO complex subunit 2 [Datura stramonium]
MEVRFWWCGYFISIRVGVSGTGKWLSRSVVGDGFVGEGFGSRRDAKWLVESALVPLRFFQERCEEEFLWESEMIKIKAADLKSKEVRVNTRLLYQQTKFNLLREESEGYAKLVTLLCQIPEGSTQNASAATVGIIKSLIGHFDLDPNRVFDIVLECFERQPCNSIFLDLIPIFPKSHASQILGFKFQYYQRLEVNDPVPSEIYQLTALLVKRDFIDVDSIYAHLLPKEEDAFDHYNAFSAKRLDEANKIGRINLAATGKDLMDEEKQGDVTVDLYAALDMETEAVAERSSELESSQPLGLLMGFLEVDDWYHARVLFDRLSHLNPAEHVQICDGLFRTLAREGQSISLRAFSPRAILNLFSCTWDQSRSLVFRVRKLDDFIYTKCVPIYNQIPTHASATLGGLSEKLQNLDNYHGGRW